MGKSDATEYMLTYFHLQTIYFYSKLPLHST